MILVIMKAINRIRYVVLVYHDVTGEGVIKRVMKIIKQRFSILKILLRYLPNSYPNNFMHLDSRASYRCNKV